MANVCVFCGSSSGNDPVFAATAAELGAELARGGHGLVYGGGRVGLMGVVADAVLRAGGSVCGYIPKALVDREVAHAGLTELIPTASMHERKAAMCDRSDGFVALPGGFGTLDEVMEILTWNQLGIVAKPVVFLDVNGYFEQLFAFLDGCVASGLVKPVHRAMAQRVDTAAAAVLVATGPAPVTTGKWTDPSLR